jgi:hypothetical protein
MRDSCVGIESASTDIKLLQDISELKQRTLTRRNLQVSQARSDSAVVILQSHKSGVPHNWDS